MGKTRMFWHEMTWETRGISVTSPVLWRCYEGIVAAFWQAQSQPGAQAYYVARDPRLILFLDDVSRNITMSTTSDRLEDTGRPMLRAVYVPAGLPMWTKLSGPQHFAHLNLHIHQDRLLGFLRPALGGSMALAAMNRPVQIDDPHVTDVLSHLLVREIEAPSRSPAYAENLIGTVFASVLEVPHQHTAPTYLSNRQVSRISAAFAESGCRMSVGQMANLVGLSESWFAHAFKQATGVSPGQWKAMRRIEIAKKLLSETELSMLSIAYHCGYSDQSHFARSFRQLTGSSPANWRRLSRNH